jgi:hypothetical protein
MATPPQRCVKLHVAIDGWRGHRGGLLLLLLQRASAMDPSLLGFASCVFSLCSLYLGAVCACVHHTDLKYVQ